MGIAKTRKLGDTDVLKACLKYRDKLGWTWTNLGELYAFISFAVAYPSHFFALVDSYSTMASGIRNFLLVALVLKDLGYDAKGIRLDSGDLAELSKSCRALMDETGSMFGYDFSKIGIAASDGI